MLKKISYLLFLFVFAVSCKKDPEISQSQEDFHLKVFGGSSTDCCYSIISDGENFFLTGSIDYQKGQDLFLIKTDKYGNEVNGSPKFFGSAGTEIGYDIALDRAQNIVMTGYSQQPGLESSDVFVVKANSSGDEVWSKRFGGIRDEKAFAVNVSATGTIYIAGYTENVDYDIKRRQGWLLALSENGDSIWSHDYGTSFVSDELHGITEMKDSLLLVGSTQSLFGNFKQDVFLFILKKSTMGIENSTTLFRLGNETGLSAVYTPSGEIFVLGYTQVSSTVNNIVIWNLGENLQLIKEQLISSTVSETPSKIIYNNGNLVVVGTTINDLGNEEYLTYILDSGLNTISRNVYGSKGNHRGYTGVVAGRSIVIGGSSVSGNSSKASIYKTPQILP